MSTFIERYGYVKYKSGLYQATGPCEIPGCEESRRRELTGEFRRCLEMWEYLNSKLYIREPLYVVDHCHKHDFVRGIVCGTCNNLLREYDRNGYPTVNLWVLAYFAPNPVTIHDTDLVRKLNLGEYAKNCPECAGLTDYRISKIPTSERKKQMSQCPNCLGDGIEPRPNCRYYNNENPPCMNSGEEPPCSQCGPEHDKPCSYCNGIGKAERIARPCSLCGNFRTIYWLDEMCCRECFESMEPSDPEYWEEWDQIMSEIVRLH